MDQQTYLQNDEDIALELQKAKAHFAAHTRAKFVKIHQHHQQQHLHLQKQQQHDQQIIQHSQPHSQQQHNQLQQQQQFSTNGPSPFAIVPSSSTVCFPPHHSPHQQITPFDFHNAANNWPVSSLTFDSHPTRIPDYSRSRNRSRRSSHSRIRSQGNSPIVRRRSTLSRRSARKDAKQPYYSAPVSPLHSRPSSPTRMGPLHQKLERLSTNDAVVNAVQSIMMLSTTIAEDEDEGEDVESEGRTYLSLATVPFTLTPVNNCSGDRDGVEDSDGSDNDKVDGSDDETKRYSSSFSDSSQLPLSQEKQQQMQRNNGYPQNMTVLSPVNLQLQTPTEQHLQRLHHQQVQQVQRCNAKPHEGSSRAAQLCEGLRLSVADRCKLLHPRPASNEELLSMHSNTHVEVYANSVLPNMTTTAGKSRSENGSLKLRGRSRTRIQGNNQRRQSHHHHQQQQQQQQAIGKQELFNPPNLTNGSSRTQWASLLHQKTLMQLEQQQQQQPSPPPPCEATVQQPISMIYQRFATIPDRLHYSVLRKKLLEAELMFKEEMRRRRQPLPCRGCNAVKARQSVHGVCSVCYGGLYKDIRKWFKTVDCKKLKADGGNLLEMLYEGLIQMERGCRREYKCIVDLQRIRGKSCTRCRSLRICLLFPQLATQMITSGLEKEI
eukprot:m.109706 g.109706  ORF g.109706 m.109706 type:complete len:660 (+) comp12737_c1_seq5:140-2119(+)